MEHGDLYLQAVVDKQRVVNKGVTEDLNLTMFKD